jgi:hypothetical protein
VRALAIRHKQTKKYISINLGFGPKESRMNITRNLTALVIVLVLSTSSFAQFVDFGGQTADAPTWTGNAFGGTVTASFSSSFSNSAVRWAPQTKSFTDPNFQNMFGGAGSLILMQTQNDQPTASTSATFVFSNPLPSDAYLVVMDYDGIRERLALSSNDGSIGAPTEIETNSPGASSFALWSQTQQRLLSTEAKNNDREAYLFNVGGRTHLNLVLSASEAAASWVGFAQPLAVPEPGSLSMIFIGLVALGLRRRRS